MRNLLRIAFVALVLWSLLPACTTVQHAEVPPVLVEDTEQVVSIEFVSKSYAVGVRVRFSMFSYEYTHVVQEIVLDSGEVLVECFRMDFNGELDLHSWKARPHAREMTVYAAVCVGVDEWGGFGHLPGNGDGLYTTVGENFNALYQSGHETRGFIEKRAKNQYYWTIRDDGDEIHVFIDGKVY